MLPSHRCGCWPGSPGWAGPKRGTQGGSAWCDGVGDGLGCFMMSLPAAMCQSNEESLTPSHGMEMEVPWADQDAPVSAHL